MSAWALRQNRRAAPLERSKSSEAIEANAFNGRCDVTSVWLFYAAQESL